MIPVTDIRARESFWFMRWSKSSWGFFRWVSCSLFFISYQPFHSPCSCISRSPGSAERACGASPWQRWPPCWCPALFLGQDAALDAGEAHWEGGGDNEVAEILGGFFGRNSRRSTEPRLTLVSFKICSKLSLNTLDNHFIPFLTGQQSFQLRSMPKNCAFYTNDGNLS